MAGRTRHHLKSSLSTSFELWETYAPDTNNQATNRKNGHASSQPLEQVYTSRWEGNVRVTTITTSAVPRYGRGSMSGGWNATMLG